MPTLVDTIEFLSTPLTEGPGFFARMYAEEKEPDPADFWIGVDFDGTLVVQKKFPAIGKPVEKMVNRVKKWLADGCKVTGVPTLVRHVKIFSARAGDAKQRKLVSDWCLKHLGQRLEVTDVKSPTCVRIVDNIAVRVKENTGELKADKEPYSTFNELRKKIQGKKAFKPILPDEERQIREQSSSDDEPTSHFNHDSMIGGGPGSGKHGSLHSIITKVGYVLISKDNKISRYEKKEGFDKISTYPGQQWTHYGPGVIKNGEGASSLKNHLGKAMAVGGTYFDVKASKVKQGRLPDYTESELAEMMVESRLQDYETVDKADKRMKVKLKAGGPGSGRKPSWSSKSIHPDKLDRMHNRLVEKGFSYKYSGKSDNGKDHVYIKGDPTKSGRAIATIHEDRDGSHSREIIKAGVSGPDDGTITDKFPRAKESVYTPAEQRDVRAGGYGSGRHPYATAHIADVLSHHGFEKTGNTASGKSIYRNDSNDYVVVDHHTGLWLHKEKTSGQKDTGSGMKKLDSHLSRAYGEDKFSVHEEEIRQMKPRLVYAGSIKPHPFDGEKNDKGEGIGDCKECGKPFKYKAHWRLAAGGPGSGRHPDPNHPGTKVIEKLIKEKQVNLDKLSTNNMSKLGVKWSKQVMKKELHNLKDWHKREKQFEKTGIEAGGPGSGRHPYGRKENVTNSKGWKVNKAKSLAAKMNPVRIALAEQNYAENKIQKMVAKAVGGKVYGRDSEPVDVVVRDAKGKLHGIEVKGVIAKGNNAHTAAGRSQQVYMGHGAVGRKYAWANANGARLHTVIVDVRQSRTKPDVYHAPKVGSITFGRTSVGTRGPKSSTTLVSGGFKGLRSAVLG